MWTIVLLIVSNVFMTFAWYGHLKHKEAALWITIIASWGIAFFEYCFQVPANRLGAVTYGFSGSQLKIIQEVITLAVFAVFSLLYLHEKLRWNDLAGYTLMIAAVFFIFYFRPAAGPENLPPDVSAAVEVSTSASEKHASLADDPRPPAASHATTPAIPATPPNH